MTSADHLSELIEREFATAELALREGNDGKVRVCCRRAVGLAVERYMTGHPGKQWGRDAMARLRSMASDASLPANVNDAAERLSRRISAAFSYQSGFDPLSDAKLITRYLEEASGEPADR